MFGESVHYNTGNGSTLALILSVLHGGNAADLVVFDRETGIPTLEKNVPRRHPADYGPEGGGRTWHS